MYTLTITTDKGAKQMKFEAMKEAISMVVMLATSFRQVQMWLKLSDEQGHMVLDRSTQSTHELITQCMTNFLQTKLSNFVPTKRR